MSSEHQTIMNLETRKAVLAGIAGNAIEWYDFALYGHFSLLIGRTFFPPEEAGLAVLAAFALFSVSFFMRPLGAMLFSTIGDRYGRRRALSLSMLGMAIPTAAIGVLPTYADVGLLATLMLVALRLVQGLALGGEMGGAVTYVMEHTPGHRIGAASSLIQASTCFGLLAGTLISSVISAVLSEAEFADWGWRIPFVLGLAAAWIGYRIRRRMPESALYELARAEDRLLHNPLASLLAQHLRAILVGVAIISPMTCCFFLAFVYFNSFMMGTLQFSPSHALLATSLGLAVAIAATLASGWLADILGNRRILSIGIGFLIVGVYPLLTSFAEPLGITHLLIAYMFFVVLIGIYTSAVFGTVAGLFPTEVRYSGVSVAVNIAAPVFGSTAPLLAAWLVRDWGAERGLQLFAGYLVALCLWAVLAIRRMDGRTHTDWNKAAQTGPV